MVENSEHKLTDGKANLCNRQKLTDEEANVYDRQIRLWGLESQKRLCATTVLLIGLKGVGAEFCKNIVLAGIKAITLMDDKDATKEDCSCQFLIPKDQVGTNRAAASLERAQSLNPMVNVTIDKESVDNKPDEFFTQFNIVVATDCNLEQLLRINRICHKANVKFYCSEVFGFHGYMFVDLQTHKYVHEKMVMKHVVKLTGRKKQKLEEREKLTLRKTMHYPTLQEGLIINKNIKEKSAKVLADMVSFFLLKILLKFRAEEGRNPEVVGDIELLKKLRDSELENIGVSAEKVPDEYLHDVVGEVSPVCAIVGAQLAQEVVKVVSQKGPPYNNFFFFDPIAGHGIVIKNGQ